MTKRYVLLNPGPVTLSESVREAMTSRDMCHREQSYSDMMQSVRRDLCQVYDLADEDWTSVLITGSGTSAVEAMVSSFVSEPGEALVAANGVYGERIATMLTHAGRAPVMVRSDWIEAINFEAVEQRLRSSPSIKYVIAVHHETTTGRLNDLDQLAAICQRHGKRMLVDAVSSFGAERLEFEDWPVAAIAATANKCLHGVPGVAFVIANRDEVESEISTAPSLYLDIATNYAAQQSGFPAFTPAIQSMYALQQAILELRTSGGWRKRHDVYRQRMECVVEGLGNLEIEPLWSSAVDRSVCLSSFLLPEGCSYQQLSKPLEQNQIIIYAGQKTLADRIFRIAVMGDLSSEDLSRLISIVGQVLRR